jgi:hypothetical protein
VERIVAPRITNSIQEYFVNWVGFQKLTWEFAENLDGVQGGVNEFQSKMAEPIEQAQ